MIRSQLRHHITQLIVAACVFGFLLQSNHAHAHDVASGRSMGMPPKIGQIEAELKALLPPDASEDEVRETRGVMLLAARWPQFMRVTVCFIGGSLAARSRVAETAQEWSTYSNLKFDFGEPLRSCQTAPNAHIKISFIESGPESGYWSYIGTQSLRFSPSMNLGNLGRTNLPPTVSGAEAKGIILHEFGHAIGLEHEHQSPSARCDAEFDPAAVSAWAASIGWGPGDVKVNLGRLETNPGDLAFTEHDRRSIMHYSLPPELLKGGKNNRCWVPKNNDLSSKDREFVASIYPKLVASAESRADRGRVAAPPSTDPSKEAEDTYIHMLKQRLVAIYGGRQSSKTKEQLVLKLQRQVDSLRGKLQLTSQ